MNPMVLSGDAHISEIVAAYDVGTLTSYTRPVASSSTPLRISPPAMISSALTDGTKRTLIGLSAVPISTMASVVVVSGAAVVVVAASVVVVVSSTAAAVVVVSSLSEPHAAAISANARTRTMRGIFLICTPVLIGRSMRPSQPPNGTRRGRANAKSVSTNAGRRGSRIRPTYECLARRRRDCSRLGRNGR